MEVAYQIGGCLFFGDV